MPDALTLKLLQQEGARRLRDAGIETAALDARLLLCHAAGISHENLVAGGNQEAAESARTAFEALVARRAGGEPVARILGEKEFWGLTFRLGPDTLVPRPDSECIVAAVLDGVTDRNAPLRVLDLGTGTGCLLLALLSELPNASGVGVDISKAALDVARANAKALGLNARACFVQSNWAEGVEGPFDIIVSNPPYIPASEIETLSREVREHDPLRALEGGADGLDCYRVILKQAPKLLAPKGQIVLETSPGVYDVLLELIRIKGRFTVPTKVSDLAGRARGLRFAKDEFAS